MKKLKLFWWELITFAGKEYVTFYSRPHYERIIPNFLHWIKYGYISYIPKNNEKSRS